MFAVPTIAVRRVGCVMVGIVKALNDKQLLELFFGELLFKSPIPWPWNRHAECCNT